MSLIYGGDFTGNEVDFPSGSEYNFRGLLRPDINSGIIEDASQLILPATTLTNGCYYEMFKSCKSLTSAPIITQATIQSGYPYDYMFQGCSSLESITIENTNIRNHDYILYKMSPKTIVYKKEGVTTPSNPNNLTIVTLKNTPFNVANAKAWTINNKGVKRVVDSLGRVIWGKPTYRIQYTTTDNNQISISSDIIDSHTFDNGVGTIILKSSEIPYRFFYNQTTLRTLSYGRNITFNRSGYQHEGCTNLESVDLPSNLTFIPQRLFRSCSKLGRVDLPASVITWSRAWPFYYTGSLTPNGTVDVYVHNDTSLPTIDTYGGGVYDYDFYVTGNHGGHSDINIENLIRLHVPSSMYNSYVTTEPHKTVEHCISSFNEA